MDMNVAGADGLSLVTEWRRQPALAFPIVALTAHAMRGDRERFLAGGCDGYISKPINTRTFLEEVGRPSPLRGRRPGRRRVDTKDLLRPGGEVLAVDDQEENRELLEELLREAGYTVRLAVDGRAALDEVARAQPDCVVLDAMMPRLDGFAVCTHLKGGPRTAFLPVIMLTALSDVGDKVRGLEAGADDFLNKPVRREELLARVRSLVRIKRLREELDSSETVIFTMVRALESRDPRGRPRATGGGGGHGGGPAPGPGPREMDAVAKGGLLHDVGKLGLHDDLLRLPRTPEMDADPQFRRHPEIGERILLPLRSLAAAREVVRHHHERLDGSGYPDRLFRGEVSLPSQLVAIANFYDGLVHEASWSPTGQPPACARRRGWGASAGRSRRPSWRAGRR